MIECATCKNEFTPLFDDTYQQATGCSAEIYQKDDTYFMRGYYGSTIIDMEIYRVASNTEFKKGNICDNCIEQLLNKGHAVKIANGVW